MTLKEISNVLDTAWAHPPGWDSMAGGGMIDESYSPIYGKPFKLKKTEKGKVNMTLTLTLKPGTEHLMVALQHGQDFWLSRGRESRC